MGVGVRVKAISCPRLTGVLVGGRRPKEFILSCKKNIHKPETKTTLALVINEAKNGDRHIKWGPHIRLCILVSTQLYVGRGRISNWTQTRRVHTVSEAMRNWLHKSKARLLGSGRVSADCGFCGRPAGCCTSVRHHRLLTRSRAPLFMYKNVHV